MLGSPFIFNPILWVILLTIAFIGDFIPKDMGVEIPAIIYYDALSGNKMETLDWEYDNIDDDIVEMKSHIKIGTDIYVFKSTHSDIPENQCQEVTFTDSKGNVVNLYYRNDYRYPGEYLFDTELNFVEYPFICKTEYPDKSGYWEASDIPGSWVEYIPKEKRTGSEVEFSLLCDNHYPYHEKIISFTYYVLDDNGNPKAADRINLTYKFENDSLVIVNETHGFE